MAGEILRFYNKTLQPFYSSTRYTHQHDYSQATHHLCRHRRSQHCHWHHNIHSIDMAHRAATIGHHHVNHHRDDLQLSPKYTLHLQNRPPANHPVHLYHPHWPMGFTANRHMVTHPTVRNNQHFWFEHGKISRHQHQSDVEFRMVPNRISRNKEKTPP